MRTFVLLLMIALLPVRVWAGDDMAVRMAKTQVEGVSVSNAAAAPLAPSANMPEDCPMFAMATNNPVYDDDNDHNPAGYCPACYLCAPVAAQPEHNFPRYSAHSTPVAASASLYSDTDLAPDLRPPISS